MALNQSPAVDIAPKVGMRELVAYFSRLGLMGFGGPVALVGQMEKELVGDRKWLTREQMREAAGATCHPGRHLHLLSSRWILGSVGRRLGIHFSKLRDRRGTRGPLRLPRRSQTCDRDLLWGKPCGNSSHTSFELPARKARHGRLAAVGHRGSVCRYHLRTRGGSGAALHRVWRGRRPLLRIVVQGRQATDIDPAVGHATRGCTSCRRFHAGRNKRADTRQARAGALTFGSGLVI